MVTGASSGIGAAISRALAQRDWRLVLLARREDRLRALADELHAEHHVCDVSQREDVERVAAAVMRQHPQLQLLVNNAGIPGRAGFSTIEPEQLEEVLRINYLGSVWGTYLILGGLFTVVGMLLWMQAWKRPAREH